MSWITDFLGGGGNSNTSTTEPWKPAQGAMKDVLSGAQAAYNSGIGSQVYTGSTVIPMASQTTTGLASQLSAANGAQPIMNKAFNVIGAQAANASGMTPQQQQAMNTQMGIMNGTGLTPAQEAAMKQQQATAGGAFLNSNKYLDNEISQNANDIARHEAMNASGSGRYGSGGFQAVTQNQIGRMANTARMDNYARERGMMEAAQNSVFGMGQQGTENRTGASNNVYGMGAAAQNQNIANNQALTGAYGNTMAPGQTMRDVGAQYEDLAKRQMDDRLRIFNEKQNQPWKQIGLLSGAISGTGTAGSTTTAAAPSNLSAALGGAIGGYQIGGPTGALLGGAAGYYQNR